VSGALDLYGNKSQASGSEESFEELVEEGSRGFGNSCTGSVPKFMGPEGQVIEGRCKRNSCPRCYGLKMQEWAQIVFEDSLESPPTHAITFTTRDPVWDGVRYCRSRAHLMQALRKRYGRQVESLEFMEQQTGKAPTSGGHRRGHGHGLFKGLEGVDVLELESFVREGWRSRMGAWQISVAELRSAAGAVHYLTLNFTIEKGKLSQAPTELPKGTRTIRPTRGYWSRPVSELRDIAREKVLRSRLAWRLEQELGWIPEFERKELIEVAYQEKLAEKWLWLRPERPCGYDFLEDLEALVGGEAERS